MTYDLNGDGGVSHQEFKLASKFDLEKKGMLSES